MEFLVAACTDVGIRKESNQDSSCIKIARTDIGTIAMAVICDGMGGLSKGELASATVIKAFSAWFENELPGLIDSFSVDEVKYRWDRLIKEQNYRIAEYGRSINAKLGTTLTALLIVGSGHTIICHVGDSRAYRIKDKIEVLTEDQTVVGREVRRGLMTPEEAENDPRRNVLLQCIGASRTVIPDFIIGDVEKNCIYMLCSDGFRHKLTADEIFENLKPEILSNSDIMQQKIRNLVELNKMRMENDNITALLIKTV